MTIVIAGGSGFLGAALARGWRADGHRVLVLTRRPRQTDDVAWDPAGRGDSWHAALDGAEAIVNLAGEGIGDRRWTAARKAAILDSRVRSTRAIVRALARVRTAPRVMVSSSAVGFYGADRGDEVVTEDSAPGADFLAQVCRQWEAEAAAAAAVTRLVLLRSGVVLAKDEGALPQMAMPFHVLAGGRLGTGRQYVSWIHLADWVSMVRWAVASPDVSGPLNATAPAPATNAAFAHALGRAMRRPAAVPAPAFALRLALGEMADALLLGGQRVLPAKAQREGFTFRFPDLAGALLDIYRTQGRASAGPVS